MKKKQYEIPEIVAFIKPLGSAHVCEMCINKTRAPFDVFLGDLEAVINHAKTHLKGENKWRKP